ncbi:hypothetical protein GJAV_G00245240 [Gymnothorax javanicus]|nr:hypothetical protein GJAV_G00245240 [Gymnothorax javanicus]
MKSIYKGVKGHSTTMESNKSRGVLKLAVFLAVLGQGASKSTMDLEMCGMWKHGKSRDLWFDVGSGCEEIKIAANETTLSIKGKITGNCSNASMISLPQTDAPQSKFCVYWEPLLDLLQVEIEGQNHTLCKTAALQKSCCTSLSNKNNSDAPGKYGIMNGTTRGDIIQKTLQESYTFFGEKESCTIDLCNQDSVELIEQVALRSGAVGHIDLPCAQISTQKLVKASQGLKVIMQEPEFSPLESGPSVTVLLPSTAASSGESGATVVLTFYPEKNSQFQDTAPSPHSRILNGILGISIEDRIIANLPDPVKIVFHHARVAKNESARCVFWDPKKDPGSVTWRDEGCITIRREEETECQCDHLTYFAILVELDPGSPVDDLEALTYITSVGCAISLCSCVVLIILHTRALRVSKAKEKSSISLHRNLAIALLLLCTLFVLTGVLANVKEGVLCRGVGAALHYALLCSFSWMAIEVFTAFWLVYRVMNILPSLRLFNLVGFGLPAILVIVFVCINDVYGVLDIAPRDGITNPFKMCWIKNNSTGRLVHFITNLSFAVAIVLAGLVMLGLVLRQVRPRKEWKQNRMTFISIWGLSCLFGCTWGIILLKLGPLPRAAMFIFCIVNSLQGFLLMVRFLLLEWLMKWAPLTESSSTGSTRQHMLKDPE